MDISLRSVLTAGVTAVAATAIVAAPAVVPIPEAETVTVPAISADVAPVNWASDVITSVYGFTEYWATYVSLDLGPWIIGFVPFGYLINDQIYIWYPGGWSPGFVLPVTDAFVFQFLNPVVNDPLNLGVWGAGIGAVANTAWNGLIGSLGNEITYALSLAWLPFPIPPLPPLPFAASTAATLDAQVAALNPVAQAIVNASNELAAVSETIWGSWTANIAPGVQDVVDDISSDLNSSSLPFAKLAGFELNSAWNLLDTEADALTGLPFDLSRTGNQWVYDAFAHGLAEATEEAVKDSVSSLVTNTGIAVHGVNTFVRDQARCLTGGGCHATALPSSISSDPSASTLINVSTDDAKLAGTPVKQARAALRSALTPDQDNVSDAVKSKAADAPKRAVKGLSTSVKKAAERLERTIKKVTDAVSADRPKKAAEPS